MMYVLGWLLIVGSIAVWFLNLGLGALPISGTLFALGVMLAALGAVVQAVKELEKTLSSEAEKGREAYKIGTESLWKQLDAVRASVVATATPPTAIEPALPQALSNSVATALAVAPSGMGFCPGCGKVRGLAVPKCIYCGDMAPARA